jgi:glycine/D-amino acid oxidase-like deaminating enzyme
MTRTRYGASPWVDTFPRSRRPGFPRLRGSLRTRVVIVGGGLAGCMTAYAFAAAGVKVALVEAARVGMAGAGRGPGVLQGEAAASYRAIEIRHGRRAAHTMFGASRRAVLDLLATARRLDLGDALEASGAVRVLAAYGADERALARDTEARKDAGLEAVWLQAAAAVRESGVESARAAVRFRNWGVADPFRLVVGFLRAAAERGADVFERTTVRRITVRRRHVEVAADGGTLSADTVVICTGEPTDLYRPLKRHLKRRERYVVLTDRVPVSIRRQIARAHVVTDTDDPAHLVRWTADGRLVVAGGDQPRPPARGREKVLVQRTGQLMYELSRLYPPVSGIMPVCGWDLPLATTADGAMYAGPHRNYPRHLFAWATRHDPSQAFLASRILLRRYLGEPDREDVYFSFTRG